MHRIIFSGQVQEGHDLNDVKARIGKLFKIHDQAKLEMLFSGKAITLKKDMAPIEAEKYQAAIIKAGALVVIDPPLPETPSQQELAEATVHGRSLNMQTLVSSSAEELEEREQGFEKSSEDIVEEAAGSTASLAINTSGAGPGTAIPQDAKGLSWGGFFWNWIWGLFNGTYIALLGLIPIVNIVVSFWLLFKGRELAWQNKRWDSLEHFNTTQKRWAIAGLLLILLSVLYVAWGFLKLNQAKNEFSAIATEEWQSSEEALIDIEDEQRREQIMNLKALMEEAKELEAEYEEAENY